ncbi:MAG: YIP1 family protein [Treponema sp.]
MKNRMIKNITACLFVAVAFIANVNAISPKEAPVPYLSYSYGTWGDAVPATPAYEPNGVVNGFDLGIGALKSPSDLCKDLNGNIAILDAGNKRVVIVNSEMKLVNTIEAGSGKSFESGVELKDPQGICFDKHGRLYIADKVAHAVFVCNSDGTLIRKIIKPISEIIDEKTEFQPIKCLIDSNNILYVLSFGSYEGAYTFDENGDFLGFFGSNKVNVNSQLLSDRFWRHFTTKAQRERMYRYVPIEYENFAIDSKNFIYTVSNFGEQETKGQVRKLNPLSQNILYYGKKPNTQFFGDIDTTWSNVVERSSLVAVDVDEDGFINVLDFGRGRIFQYDKDSYLLTIFGGNTNQVGSFTSPCDLVSVKGNIFVLDSVKGSLTKFQATDYGKSLHEALILHDEGYYEEALVPWFNALKADSTNWMVLKGIGLSYERAKDYKSAMHYFKLGENNKLYSEAFHEYRTEVLRKNFGWVMAIIIALLLIPLIKFIYRKARHIQPKPVDHAEYISKNRFPFYIMAHPFKGWEELKHEKNGSLLYANIILVVWFIMQILEYQYTGFSFNGNRLDEMNIFVILGSTFGIFLLWCVCNWGVCTLFDGKGTFKEVWIFSAYALLFYVILIPIIILLSNVLYQGEAFFLGLVQVVQKLYLILQMVLAVKAVHQYTMKKTVGSILLTLLGIVLVVLVILLFVSLFTQMWSFLETVFQEILMRF